MNSLTIVTLDKILILAPVPAGRLMVLQTLLETIHNLWQSECNHDTELFLTTMPGYLQQIADLIPRLDTPDSCNGFSIEMLTTLQITDLFFYQVKDEKAISSQLIELHQSRFSEEPALPPPSWGDDIGDWTPPVESCGDIDTDLLAMLSVAFKASGAIRIFNSYDRETINLWIKQFNAYSQPAQERREAWIAQMQSDYKEQNAQVYRDAMGLGNIADQLASIKKADS